MHAWEAIQKSLIHIEQHLVEEIQMEELAETVALSLFYYQRLFTRLVNTSVRDYIKLRRLARSLPMLRDRRNRIIDIAMEYGFGSHVTYTRAFKEAYGISPSQYRHKQIDLQNFELPDLLLGQIVVDEGVPLICDGLVLEINRKLLNEPISFVGVTGYYPFTYGRMAGERTGIDTVSEIWSSFFQVLPNLPHISQGCWVGVSYHGDAPDGYSTYFVGAPVKDTGIVTEYANWQLPVREYIVCGFETESSEQMKVNMGKAMKYTRYWLRKHNLIADGFFPELYYKNTSDISCVELWIPFKERDN